MKKNLKYIIPAIVLLLGAFGVFSHRFDLTKEKRYTLSDATIATLKSVQEPLTIDVYLEGDFPANFKLLGGADYILQNLGFYHHFMAFTRGLIDTQDVFYFLFVIGVSLFLAKIFVEKKK